ncbi:MAG: twin-arginine translocation signal domain-containing protein [Candidatus Reddybacter sp.]
MIRKISWKTSSRRDFLGACGAAAATFMRAPR